MPVSAKSKPYILSASSCEADYANTKDEPSGEVQLISDLSLKKKPSCLYIYLCRDTTLCCVRNKWCKMLVDVIASLYMSAHAGEEEPDVIN